MKYNMHVIMVSNVNTTYIHIFPTIQTMSFEAILVIFCSAVGKFSQNLSWH